MTELRPTSLPVPAVVGMAMNGARPSIGASHGSVRQSGTSDATAARTILATSSALPPPKPITPSQAAPRKASAAPTTSASMGFGWTSEKTATFSPSTRRNARKASVFRSPGSVTTSGLSQRTRASSTGSESRLPSPKTMRVGKAKVVSMGSSAEPLTRFALQQVLHHIALLLQLLQRRVDAAARETVDRHPLGD